MPFSINPDLIENNDVEIQTVDGELALFHKPSGNTLIVDEDTTVSEKLQSPLRDNVDLDGNDLISGGSGEFAALEAGDVSITNAGSILSSTASITQSSIGLSVDANVSTTSDSFEELSEYSGGLDLRQIPDGASLYANQIVWTNSPVDSPLTLRPKMRNVDGNSTGLTELELTVDSTFSLFQTGWTEITSLATDPYLADSLEGKVETAGEEAALNQQYALLFEWRVD